MALDIGELVGKLSIDDKGMDKGLKQGESKFKKFGDKLSGLALAGGLAVGAALMAGLVGAVDQGSIGAKIAAQLGGSAKDAKSYGASAGKLYAEGWGDSVETIGETIKTVAKAKIVDNGTPALLQDAARSAQILSDVFGQDVDGSVRAVQQLIRNGLVPDAKAGFDLIAASIQNGVDKSDDLLDTLNEYPTEFRELGLTGKQAMGLLSQGLKAGARDGDTVADALKEFAIRSKDASTTSAAGFKLIGLNGEKMTKIFAKGGPEAAAALDNVLDRLRAMKDPVAQNTAAVDLFGTKAEDLGNSLFSLDLTTAEQGFENTAGSIDRANKAASDTPGAKLESFKRTLEQTATTMAVGMIPNLIKMGGWLKDNKGWVIPLASALGILAAGIVAVNLATKAWAATEAAFATVKGVATAAQWLWNASLLAFPGTWIVLGILAIIAVIVLIATKTTWFQTLWKYVWGGIKSAASAVWGWISGTLWPGIKAVLEAIGAAAMWLWHNSIEPAMAGIGKAFAFVWRIVASFANLFKYFVVEVIGGSIMWLWHALQPTLANIGALFVWLYQNVLTPVGHGITAALSAIGAAAVWLWQNAISPAINGIASAFTWLWHSVIEPAGRGIATAAMWVWTNGIKPAYEWIKSGTKSVGDFIAGVFSRVGGWIGDAFSGAVGIVKSALNGIIGAINSAIGAINGVINSANKIPGVSFPTIPKIPKFAQGGAVTPSAGGTPVIMGDGGQVEYGIPDNAFQRYVRDAVAAGGGSGGGTMRVELALDSDGVLKVLRSYVKNRAGGSAQVALGGR